MFTGFGIISFFLPRIDKKGKSLYNINLWKKNEEQGEIMKKKLVAAVFGILGLGLALATVVLSLAMRNAPVVMLSDASAAQECAEGLLDAVCRGNFRSAEGLLLGTPSLGADRQAKDAVGQLLWDAYLDSMEYTLEGDCYACDEGIAQDVTITALDFSSVTGVLKERSEALLTKRVEQAEDISQVYDADNNYREEFVMDVLYDAAAQALQTDAKTTQQKLTLYLVYRQGQWWVKPDRALIGAISGGTVG